MLYHDTTWTPSRQPPCHHPHLTSTMSFVAHDHLMLLGCDCKSRLRWAQVRSLGICMMVGMQAGCLADLAISHLFTANPPATRTDPAHSAAVPFRASSYLSRCHMTELLYVLLIPAELCIKEKVNNLLHVTKLSHVQSCNGQYIKCYFRRARRETS